MLDFLLGNDAVLTIFAFILVLIPAVLIHEMGHFLAAKLVGITVLEFGIGMPPRMVRLFRHRGTDYTLNWLPLGGFVRPVGEDIVRPVGDEAMQSDRDEAIKRGITNPKSVYDVKPLPRILFMAGGALANFLTALLLFAVIALGGIPAVVATPFDAPSDALAEAGLQHGDTIIAINGQNMSSGADLLSTFNSGAGTALTLTVQRGDTTFDVNYTAVTNIDEAEVGSFPIILGIAEDSPAALAGLQENDLVTAFNGASLATYSELQELTSGSLGQEVTLTVWRSGELVDVPLTPRANPPEGQGALGIQIGDAGYDVSAGLVYLPGMVSRSLSGAVAYSFERMGNVISTIMSLPGRILSQTAAPEELRVVSPLEISRIGGVLFEESVEQNRPGIILEYMALISFALGMTNLLPIPALDGGRILFVLIEILRGRPISPEREGMVHLVGMIVLLSLMFIVLINDVINPMTDLFR